METRTHMTSKSPSFLATVLVGAVFAMGAIFGGPAMAENMQTYTLVCRGGPDMFVTIYGEERARVEATVGFRPAPVGANERIPESGTCAWRDRALRAHEPRLILIRDASPRYFAMTCQRGGCELLSNSPRVENLVNRSLRSTLFEIQVFNDQEGHLVIPTN